MVQIDQIDTEIEITPGGGTPATPARRDAPASAATQHAPIRETILATLDSALEEYLRMRG
jgi:hypothetical protein